METLHETNPRHQARARRIVKFWRRRGWLSGSSPIHVHPLDLEKLEELIADGLADPDGDGVDAVE